MNRTIVVVLLALLGACGGSADGEAPDPICTPPDFSRCPLVSGESVVPDRHVCVMPDGTEWDDGGGIPVHYIPLENTRHAWGTILCDNGSRSQ